MTEDSEGEISRKRPTGFIWRYRRDRESMFHGEFEQLERGLS